MHESMTEQTRRATPSSLAWPALLVLRGGFPRVIRQEGCGALRLCGALSALSVVVALDAACG